MDEPKKLLLGTFMGGLDPEIAKGIRLFKPKTLKEAISLARMKDDHLIRQKKIASISNTTSSIMKPSPTMKRLSWEECRNGELKACASIGMKNSL